MAFVVEILLSMLLIYCSWRLVSCHRALVEVRRLNNELLGRLSGIDDVAAKIDAALFMLTTSGPRESRADPKGDLSESTLSDEEPTIARSRWDPRTARSARNEMGGPSGQRSVSPIA